MVLLFTAAVSGLVMIASGFFFFYQSFLSLRKNLNRSLNETLDVVRVVKTKESEGQGGAAGEKEEISRMEQLFASLSSLPEHKNLFHRLLYGAPQISLEIAVPSDSEQITFFVSSPKKYRGIVEKQIHSFFSSAHIERVKDYSIFRPQGRSVGSYLKFKKSDFFPIRTYQYLEADPLQNITNALSKLEDKNEGAAIQIVFRKSKTHWKSRGEQIAQKMQQGVRLKDATKRGVAGDLTSGMGNKIHWMLTGQKYDSDQIQGPTEQPVTLTPEEQDIIKRLEGKANKARFDVNIRLLASAETKERAEMILAEMENSFVQFEDTNLNKFVTKRDRGLNAHKLAYNYIFRNHKKSQNVVMDTEELASVFHFPISTTETPRVDLLKSKTAPPPTNVPKDGLLVGFSDYRGANTQIRLTPNDRRRHLYIIGQTGTGKSTIIEEMAKQDAKKDGMCIIDPHGDLIDHVMENIPKERADDVIYFDPSDTERPFGLNMMEYEEGKSEQRTFVINEIIAIFDKLYDLKSTGGPMFEQYMRNAMLLVMDSPETGSTLMEIPRVFRDVEFRRDKLKRCKDMTVVEFWEKEAEKAGGDASLENIAPYITSKLVTFISNDMMRPIIAQQKSTINFREVMDGQKILLVNLSKGKIGEINSHLLGMIIVGKLLMSALGRVDLPEEDRKDFYLYIDEFQNFTTNSIAQILAEARKYRLALTVAHQFIGQLSDEISQAVFGNVGSMCVYRVGADDAEFLQKQFAPVFDVNDLINIDNYQCFTKVLLDGKTSEPFNMHAYPPTEGSGELCEHLKEYSRTHWGRPKAEVEKEIEDRFFSKPDEEEDEKKVPGKDEDYFDKIKKKEKKRGSNLSRGDNDELEKLEEELTRLENKRGEKVQSKSEDLNESGIDKENKELVELEKELKALDTKKKEEKVDDDLGNKNSDKTGASLSEKEDSSVTEDEEDKELVELEKELEELDKKRAVKEKNDSSEEDGDEGAKKI